MIASMTGFSSGTISVNDFRINVDIRTLNHRYLDIHCRLPEGLYHLEMPLRALLKDRLKRGRVDVRIQVEPSDESGQVTLNEVMYRDYMAIIHRITTDNNLSGFDPVNLLSMPDMLTSSRDSWVDEVDFVRAMAGVIDPLVADRLREGRHLWDEICTYLEDVKELVSQLESLALEQKQLISQRFQERLARMAPELDDTRLLTEVALLIDKADINEEMVRLQAHIKEYFAAASTGEPVGRKLDFLGQEMLREVNTIASKSVHYPVSQIVVDLKSLLEKIREQVQNIE